MRTAFLSLLALSLSTTAAAFPRELNQQGRLHDALGDPLDGSHTLDFRLYSAPAGGTALWEESVPATLVKGYYSVTLGETSDNGLDDTWFEDNSELYLALAVDSGPELTPRLKLVTAPYAIVAGSLEGGTVDAASISVGGTEVIDSSGMIDWSHISGAPTDADTLASLSCTDDQIPAMVSGSWACIDNAHTHVPADVVGVFDVIQLPVGTGIDTVAAGDHSHTADDVGALPASGGTVSGPLGVDGQLTASAGLQLGDSSVACDDIAHEGILRWSDLGLEVCTDSGWTSLAIRGPDGSTQEKAGESCKTIAVDLPDSSDGMYWVDPNGGDATDAHEVYCDMETDGGGWTLCAQLDVATASASVKIAYPTQVVGTYDTSSSFTYDCSGFEFDELLFTESWDGSGDMYMLDLTPGGISPAQFYASSGFNHSGNVRGRYLSGSHSSWADKSMMWTGNRSCPAGWNSSPSFRLSVASRSTSWIGGTTSCYAHVGGYGQQPVVDAGGHVNGQAGPDYAIGGDWNNNQYDGAERRLRGTRSQMFVR